MTQVLSGFHAPRPSVHKVDFAAMADEIARSFQRSEQYGISRLERDKNQERLSAQDLFRRLEEQKDLISAVDYFAEIFRTLLQPDVFFFAVADRAGYILKTYGSDALLNQFAERNCCPGFRWTERDVGTSAFSLAYTRKIPIQINDKDHFCRRAHNFTSSAAPILDPSGELIGVLTISGPANSVHPHTLALVMNTAGAVERELRLGEMTQKLRREAAFLQKTIDGVSSGVMLVNNAMDVIYINKSGRDAFKPLRLDPVNLERMAMQPSPAEMLRSGGKIENQQVLFGRGNRKITIVANMNPVHDGNRTTGYIMDFEPAQKAIRAADRISGTQAYFTFDSIIGNSPQMQQAISLARVGAESAMPVLLQGETGTGKELFAHAIHNACPKRRKHPFVPINCAAIPSELLESELFGYMPGSFSGALAQGKPGKFELADGGSVLLDEIGDMPLHMQAKLLRVLQSQEVCRIGSSKPVHVSVKIISCTHVDLKEKVGTKQFREDLYYRLGGFPITLPPLRDRGVTDIFLLAEFFLARFGPSFRLTAGARSVLAAYKWPGNIRELENVLQRAAYLAKDGAITADMLLTARPAAKAPRYAGGTLSDMEKALIEDTLVEMKWNISRAAKKLGITRATLYKKKKEYRIERRDL